MSDSERATLHATVRGRVQGVGFRASTVRQAGRLGLTGWVRNEPDGSVRVVAEGGKAVLEDMATWLENGPSSAHVTTVDKRYSEFRGQYDRFRVEY